MRLLRANTDGSFSLTWFAGDQIPRYAILSHRWEADNQEVTLQDLRNGTAGTKKGYRKIQFCGEQAKSDGLEFFWVDSCCIDKSSSTELSEAINSMFHWYQDAEKCYVYLSDVVLSDFLPDLSIDFDKKSYASLKSTFCQSQWFTRGWTLQELLAPVSVEFFSQDGKKLGDKRSLENQIQQVTNIPISVLRGCHLSQISIEKRMSWIVNRDTTHTEDIVYSLFGVFDIHMPLLYGERVIKALRRLGEEIEKSLNYYQLGKLPLNK
jgi:hypothetical protein